MIPFLFIGGGLYFLFDALGNQRPSVDPTDLGLPTKGFRGYRKGASHYADGGEVSLWKIEKGDATKLKTGSTKSIKAYITKNKLRSEASGKYGLQEWPSNATKEQVLKYNESSEGSATSQEYADGGKFGVVSEFSPKEKAKLFAFLDSYNSKDEVYDWWEKFGYTKAESKEIENAWAESRGYKPKKITKSHALYKMFLLGNYKSRDEAYDWWEKRGYTKDEVKELVDAWDKSREK